ncbi:MAG: extracellular repeat protein family [Verrucomicrobiales bacterium]|nr:extracellular repeat protein family [Verrucomicrobiales bacterium]
MHNNHQTYRRFVFLLLSFTAWLGSIAISNSASLVTSAVLNPVEDAHVRTGSAFQKKNFGAEPVLELQSDKNESEAYLKFDLTGADSLLKQAKLRFYAGAEKPTVATISVKSVLPKEWSENIVTWRDKPESDATLGQVQLVGTTPAWYEVDLTSAVKAELARESTSLSVAMILSDTEGNKISINSRDAVENRPELVLSRSPVKVRIVFRPTENGAPPGYVVDTGAVYAPHTNGLTYGWNTDVSKFVVDRNNPAQAVSKQVRSPDSRYAGVACMDHPEFEKPAFWGISLPNGTYSVHLVAGDPGLYDSAYAININDTLVLEGIPDQAKHWVETTKTLPVTNQKLIITNNPKGINNKLCFMEIQEVRESGK